MKLQSALDLKTHWVNELLPGIAQSMKSGEHMAAAMRAGPVRAMSLDAAGDDLTRGLAVGITLTRKGSYAMALHVERRFVAESAAVQRLKKQAHGELVVRITGRAHTMTIPRHQKRIRPLEPGLSVGHVKVTAGTLGAFVTRARDAGVHILSNNHVMANENASRLDDPIVQPGTLDDGLTPGDVVALLSARKRIFYQKPNRCDCALARLKKGVLHTGNRFPGVGMLKGLKAAEPGMKVFKVGRTTGHTHGRITDIELDRRYIEFDRADARFDGVVSIESTRKGVPFCDGGDSGSLIVSEDGFAVGLLFAGTDSGGAFNLGLTYANPIEEVLKVLKATLLIA